MWDTERAFAADSSNPAKKEAAAGGKRKKNAVDLLDGEVWRAKNVRLWKPSEPPSRQKRRR
jgi:hypothetical protein